MIARTTLKIHPDGQIEFIHDDELVEMFQDAIADQHTTRASHVEPSQTSPGTWDADLSPVGGPLLCGFAKRQAALQAEVAWLNAHYLHISS